MMDVVVVWRIWTAALPRSGTSLRFIRHTLSYNVVAVSENGTFSQFAQPAKRFNF